MKNLIAYMLLSALVEKMVPGKDYQRLVSLTGGLIMILLLLRTFISIFGGENYLNISDITSYSLEDIIGSTDEAESFLMDKPDYETIGSIYELEN